MATPGALNDPGNVWGPLVQPNPTCPDFHLYGSYPSVCLSTWAKSEAAKKKKVGTIAEILDVSSPLAPSNAICVLREVPRPLPVRRKKTFSNCPFELSFLILKMPVKYVSKIYVKSRGEMDNIIHKEMGDW